MIARPRTFLLDENMPRKILNSLKREGFDATRVYDAGLRSRPDTAVFAYARAHQMTIITFDTDYQKACNGHFCHYKMAHTEHKPLPEPHNHLPP